jgi:hypothetical protein
MSLTNLNRAGHRVLRVVSCALGSVPERFPVYRVDDADLSLVVSRQPREGRDLASVANEADPCFRWAPDLRKERRVVDVGGGRVCSPMLSVRMDGANGCWWCKTTATRTQHMPGFVPIGSRIYPRWWSASSRAPD